MKLYTFFDATLGFTTNYPPAQKEFNRIYGYFESSYGHPNINCSIEKSDNSFHVKAKSRRCSLEYTMKEEPHTDTYLSLFNPVIYEIRDYFLIHAGSLVTPRNKSLIISASCGLGKTTMTMELLKKGYEILSDELAPLNLKTGLIYPYPRGIGILKEKTKKVIDVPRDKIGNPCKPGFVILLTLESGLGAPDFNAGPRLRKISPQEGIFELSKNLLNAHPSALLEEAFSGSRPKMIFELAGLMEKARFFTLTVGKLSEMVKLICRL